jgi:uncharacterized phage protein gp47/JayE
MPWTTPSLKTVRQLTRDAITANLYGAVFIGNNVLRVMADTMAGLAHHVLRYIDWLALQLLPDTAETEWLDRHGAIWLVNSDGTVGRKQATLATGLIAATGQAGIIVPQYSQLTEAGGLGYETTQMVILSAAPVSIPVRALDPGSAGNLLAGSTLSWVNPPQGQDPTVLVQELSGGADVETDDELRSRILARIRQPPMGGDASDWQQWALAVPGVTRAWCSPLEQGMGTVTLRFMMDDLRADNYGLPTTEDVAAVQAYLDVKRPVAVKDTFVVAPIPFPLQIAINNLVVDAPSTRTSIEQQITEMLLERAIPGGTIYESWIDAAISNSLGEDHHELAFTTTQMPSPGHIAIVGSIIYAGGLPS